MLAIKLQRIGKKHQPSYRLVVAERRSKLAGPPVEDIGSYDPFTKKAELKKERILHWLKVGAKPTSTAHNLFVREKVMEGPKLKVPVRREKGNKTAQEAQATASSAPAESIS